MRPEEMVGKAIGHYRVVRSLGIGGTSTVFLAEDVNLKRDVALKLFQTRTGETQDFLRRFAREARVVAQLDHPNIVPVYEYGEEDDTAYLVMPHMTGGSLRDRLLAQKTLPPRETVQLINPILQALQYAHNRGLIHRDIKPGNILFKADGTPMLSDFGLVKITTPASSESTALMNDTASMTGHALTGTPDYMSPEQIIGNVTPVSDIYSIGVVLYEMLTGERPFKADNYMAVLMKQMYERPRPLHDLNPQLSPALEAVVLQTLEKEAARRIQRPEELRQALIRALVEPIDTTPEVGAATISTWPTVAHGALRPQQGNEHTLNADILSPPVKAAKQSESQMLYNQATPPVVTAGKIKPKRRIMLPLALTLFLVALLLVGGLGTTLLAPQLLGFGKRVHTHLSPTSTPGTTHTLVSTPAQGGSTGGITTVTQNVPATTTTCPTTGTARAAVLAPLVLGSHQDLVYIVNQFNPSAYGTLKRRDVNVPDLKATEIVKMPNVYISWAQVSRDGQWILFTARLGQQDQLRMVRVDGQGLQTLYCTPVGNFILGSQWSFNQQSVIFDAGAGVVIPSVYLLTLNDGTLETVMTPQGRNMGYLPRTWLDATHVYMVGFLPQARDAAFQNVYLLDLQKGANQPESNLQQVVASTQLCMSFDTSFDVKQFYESTCSGDNTYGFNGPSSVTVQDAKGSPPKEIFTSQTMAITMIRAINRTTLLLMVENTVGDTSQNGLWKMNIDGTNLTRLSTDPGNTQSLCPFSQYAWSNTSLDNTFYALQSNQQDIHSYGMSYGLLASGDSNQFADIRDGTQLFLVGWTQM